MSDKLNHLTVTTIAFPLFQNGTHANATLYRFLAIAVLAETAIQENIEQPWIIEEKLNKRRGVYEYDKHLQNMLLSLNGKYNTQAYCIECGNTSYYKTELCFSNCYYIHFHHSFDPIANYNQKYLDMNIEADSCRYAYFKYSLNSEKRRIVKLSFVAPLKNKTNAISIDLTESLNAIRTELSAKQMTVADMLQGLPY